MKMVDKRENIGGCGCGDLAAAGLLPVEEAISHLLSSARPVGRYEKLPLINSLGRILARDLVSPLNVPPHDNSAMDGYAVNSRDLEAGGEVSLPVSQRISAGQTGERLAPGTAARIFTGAPIPPGADAVIMQEKTRREGDQVIIAGPAEKGLNIRRMGEDIGKGDVVLKAGERLTPQNMGLAASVGHGQVQLYARPRVAVLSTGDELVDPGFELEAGKIYNSNRFLICGLLRGLGCEVVDLGIVRDNIEETRKALIEASSRADLIITSGGVSVGEEDHVRNAIEELGRLDLWRIAIKPGKPLAFGSLNDTPFIGLPGNPVSVFVTLSIIARPFILRMMGASQIDPPRFRAAAGFDWPKAKKRREYVRVRMNDNGKLIKYGHQGSGVLSSVSWADGLAVMPEGKKISKGEMIDYLPFSGLLG